MICGKCKLWLKRELPRQRKKYYPAGRCLHRNFNDGFRSMLTTENVHCRFGEPK